MFLNKNTFGRKALSVMLAAAMISSVAITTAVTTTAVETTEVTSQATATITENSANQYGLVDNIQDGNILHCFCWKYTDITAMLPQIAEAGFTSVQVSPPQPTAGTGSWWWFYQPRGFYVGSSELGNKTELTTLCTEAEKYGIKVIADIVANHLAGDHSNIDSELKDSQYWHADIGDSYDGNRYQVTHGKIGMPDLNTEHSFVQQKVANYVKELESIGVDGIRWDAAKHIGLPSEGDNFWPTVTGATDLWHYGEILNNPGVDPNSDYALSLMKEYTQYMGITDSEYGRYLREAFNSGKVIEAYGNWGPKGISNDRLVYWGESHDTWSNNQDWGYSNTMSQNTIDRAYAVAASRNGITALYFSRPSTAVKDDIRIGAKGSTHFTSSEVAAVNHFKNATNGQADYYTTGSNCSVVCRKGGAVIVAGSGSNFQVSVPNGGSTTTPGTYKDEITGNTWTVTSSTISGTIGSTGIAVIYNSTITPTEPPTAPTTPPTSTVTYVKGDATGDNKAGMKDCAVIQKHLLGSVTLDSTKKLAADVNGDGEITTTDVVIIMKYLVGFTNTYSVGSTVTGGVVDPTSPTTPTATTPVSGNYVYYKNTNNWNSVYAYYWSDANTTMTTWPGVAMTSVGDNVYRVEVPAGTQYIIFSNNGASKTGDITIPGMNKVYNNGTWSDYGPVNPTNPTTTPTTPVGNNTVYFNDSAIATGSERYAIYVWNDSGNQFIDMTSAGTNLYQATVPTGYTNIIFCRMNGSTSTNSWDNVWNQSADLTFGSQNLYTATGWGSGNQFTGNWSSK